MGDFGKRTVNARQEPPVRHALGAPQESAPAWSDQISKRDIKALEKGRLPVWTNMSQWKLLGFAVLMVAMVLGALGYYGPELARDLRHAARERPLPFRA